MVPVIIPHILHGYHMLHIAVHIVGVTLSIFVALVAFLAYQRFRTKKLLLAQIAFSVFFVAEMVTLVDVTWPGFSMDAVTLSEIGHYLLIATLGILAMGVFRND